MSLLWHFQSLSRTRFDAFVSNQDGRSIAMLTRLLGRDETLERHPHAHALIERFPHQGLGYDDLNAGQIEALDSFICALFGPEGLEDEFELEFESPEGVSPVIIDLMLVRGAGHVPIKILPALKQGRRLGKAHTAPCGYCLLTQPELGELQNEIRQILQLPTPWPELYLPMKIYENLLAVFATIETKQKDCIALLG